MSILLAEVELTQAINVIVEDVRTRIVAMVPFFRKRLRELLYRTVPVRSGKLLDTMLNNLTVDIIGDTLHVGTTTPAGYPLIIPSPLHAGEIGYGKKYTPTNPIPNAVKLRDTVKGAYYLLNDPESEGNYTKLIGMYALPIVTFVTKKMLTQGYEVEVVMTKEEEWLRFMTKDTPYVYTPDGVRKFEVVEGGAIVSDPNIEVQTESMAESRAKALSQTHMGIAGFDDIIEKMLARVYRTWSKEDIIDAGEGTDFFDWDDELDEFLQGGS